MSLKIEILRIPCSHEGGGAEWGSSNANQKGNSAGCVCFCCCTDDESAYNRQSKETWAGGSPPSELRRFEFIPFHAPSQMPPSNHQRLGSPPQLPRTRPGVQGDHPLTAPIWRTPPVFQAGCAVQQMSVESWMVPAPEGRVLPAVAARQKEAVCICSAARAQSSAEMVANLEPACQSLQWLPTPPKDIYINE